MHARAWPCKVSDLSTFGYKKKKQANRFRMKGALACKSLAYYRLCSSQVSIALSYGFELYFKNANGNMCACVYVLQACPKK